MSIRDYLAQAVADNASDLHITAGEPPSCASTAS